MAYTIGVTDGDIDKEDIATLDYPMQQGAIAQDYSFSRAKYALAKDVYADYKVAFYSRCRFRTYQNALVPVKSSCTYQPRKNPTRGGRIEWEHIVPAWVFGHQLQCWQAGGREQCRNTDKQFRQMEADMHNLVPAIGEINGDRSNYGFRMIEGEERLYGKDINMEIAFKDKAAEPPEEVWGDIARTYFYMRDRYGFRLASTEESLLRAWNNLDPVDDWEKKRNQLIANIQGNENPFVSNYRKMANTSDSVSSTSAPMQSDDLLERIYQWAVGNQNNLPYPVVIIIALVYFFLRGRNKNKQQRK